MGEDDHLVVKYWVWSDSADGDTVAGVSVSVQTGLWSVWLFEDVDGVLWGRVTAQELGLADVVTKTLLDLLEGRLWSVSELEGDTLGVAVGDGDSVALCGDEEVVVKLELGGVLVEPAEDLLGLPLDLVFLAGDVGDDVVQDVDAWDAGGEACAGDGLQGGGGDKLERAKLVDKRLQRSHKAGGGAVGDADEVPLLAVCLCNPVFDHLEVLRVGDRHNQGDVRVSSVVLGIRDDHQAALHKLLFYRPGHVRIEAREHHVTVLERLCLALRHHKALDLCRHQVGLLPRARIDVLLACRTGGRSDRHELELWVLREEEDETLSNGTGGSKNTCLFHCHCVCDAAVVGSSHGLLQRGGENSVGTPRPTKKETSLPSTSRQGLKK